MSGWTFPPCAPPRRRRSTHSWRARPANQQRPCNGASRDHELPRGYEVGRWTLKASYQPKRAPPVRKRGRRHLRIEEPLAATRPACGATDANTRHARCLCHRVGAQAKTNTSRFGPRDFPLPEGGVRPPSPSGKRCALSRRQGLRYGHIVIERRGLRTASASDFRNKRFYYLVLIDFTRTTRTPQAEIQRERTRWNIAASTCE